MRNLLITFASRSGERLLKICHCMQVCMYMYMYVWVCVCPAYTHFTWLLRCHKLSYNQKPTVTSKPQKRKSATQNNNKSIAGSYESACRSKAPHEADGVCAACFVLCGQKMYILKSVHRLLAVGSRFTGCRLSTVHCRTACLFISCSWCGAK